MGQLVAGVRKLKVGARDYAVQQRKQGVEGVVSRPRRAGLKGTVSCGEDQA